MPDREKAIKGLEQCISTDKTCSGCPYEGTTCTTTLNADALALLKEQEERIKTLESLRRIEQEGR
jgi:coenzyme F420-reducing hydrogenase gamma subunit